MRALLASPFATISNNTASHRAAQAVIYADQIKQSGIDITVNMAGDNYYEDFNKFDVLYVYHGNDWGGTLNLFGGLSDTPVVDNLINISKFKGTVFSLIIPFPDYYQMVAKRMEGNDSVDPKWHDVDWDNIKRMVNAPVVDPNKLSIYRNAAIGDSHAICMYRPGWMVNSVPFKTLHGALKQGLKSFLPIPNIEYNELEFYFGNIDIRHHLMRQADPATATIELVRKYFEQAKELNTNVKIYEPLPIEDVSRKLPKTGYYKGTPYYGTWEERTAVRKIFITECERQETDRVKLYRWNRHMLNSKGELDFKFMEKPKSVHLSREHYPHWQGLEYNNIVVNGLSEFI